MNLIFLDIDGVLNGHDFDQGAQSTRIQYRCVRQLNRVIKATNCKFVLSSAWRYMLLKVKRGYPPAMTLNGFEYMLRTHGTVGFRLLGMTGSDEAFGYPDAGEVRGRQIRAWLDEHAKAHDVGRYLALDDIDLGITEAGIPLVQTPGCWGLGRRTATEAIRLLNAIDG